MPSDPSSRLFFATDLAKGPFVIAQGRKICFQGMGIHSKWLHKNTVLEGTRFHATQENGQNLGLVTY